MIKKSRRIENIIKRDRIFLHTTREGVHFVADHGDGDFAYDVAGNKFIDFSSFVSVYNFGVGSSKAVKEAIKSQIDKLMHSAFTDYYAELPVKFGERIRQALHLQFGH
jgi:4-aminobutyrate aminotransferase